MSEPDTMTEKDWQGAFSVPETREPPTKKGGPDPLPRKLALKRARKQRRHTEAGGQGTLVFGPGTAAVKGVKADE
jgi:hypothetical protein